MGFFTVIYRVSYICHPIKPTGSGEVSPPGRRHLQVLSPLFSNIIMAREEPGWRSRGSFRAPKSGGFPDFFLGGFTLEKRHPVGWNIHPEKFLTCGTPNSWKWMVQMIFLFNWGDFWVPVVNFQGCEHFIQSHIDSGGFFRCRVEVFVSWKNRKEKYEEHTNLPHMFV